MKISWTPTARDTYFEILEYLEKSWTEKEVHAFAEKVEKVISLIAENPSMFKASEKYRNIRKGFVTKHNAIYYKVKPRKKEIELMMFWDNRQDPLRCPY